jgi:hypothetical protein
VFVEDIEAWEKKSGVRIAAGDAILLRTGRWARRAKLGPWDILKDGTAGFHASVVPWLKARGVAMIGSDSALDVLPSQVEGVWSPVHSLVITSLGMTILDNQDLEATAETAAQLGRWEFMYALAGNRRNGIAGECVGYFLTLNLDNFFRDALIAITSRSCGPSSRRPAVTALHSDGPRNCRNNTGLSQNALAVARVTTLR